MSEGENKADKAPVVAEAHDVDTYRKPLTTLSLDYDQDEDANIACAP